MSKSERFWDGQAGKYDEQVEQYEQIHIKTLENTNKHLHKADVVLDYGCGTGTFAIELADSVKEIRAIDISSKMIDAARRKAAERGIENVSFVQSTIFDERFQGESFDVILAFNVLHLLKDTHRAVQRINKLLQPGGSFISATACLGEKKSVLSILLFFMSRIGIVPYTGLFRFSELEDAITHAGFRIVDTEILSHDPPNYFVVAKKAK